MLQCPRILLRYECLMLDRRFQSCLKCANNGLSIVVISITDRCYVFLADRQSLKYNECRLMQIKTFFKLVPVSRMVHLAFDA